MRPILRLLIVLALAGAGRGVAHGQMRQVVGKVVGKVAADQLGQVAHENCEAAVTSAADVLSTAADLEAIVPPQNSALRQALRRRDSINSAKMAAETVTANSVEANELLPISTEPSAPILPWRNTSTLWLNQN